jgi:hypothetical protein
LSSAIQLDAVLHLLAGQFHLTGQRVCEPDEDLGGWIARSCKGRYCDRSDQEEA